MIKRSLFFLCMFSLYAAANEFPKDRLPHLEVTPQIDGTIEAHEWQSSYSIPNVTSTLPQTQAWVGIDSNHLYLAIRAQEPNPESIRTVVIGDEIQGTVWNDDSIEILIDLENRGQTLHRLVFNTEGTFYNSLLLESKEDPNGWNSEAIIKTRITRSYWEAEIAIPLHHMGHIPQTGEVIAINFGRYRHAGGQTQVDSLAGRRFLNHEDFAKLLIRKPLTTANLSLVSPQRGPFIDGKEGAWEFQIVKGQLTPEAVGIAVPGLPTDQEVQVQFDGKTLKIPFAAHQVKAMSQLSLHYNGEELYHAQYDPKRPSVASRIRQTTDPLFQSLIEPFPDGLAKLGVINWAHEIMRNLIKIIPLRTGMAYQHYQTPYENYQRDRSILLVTLGWIQHNPKIFKRLTDYNIPIAVYLRKKAGAIEQGAPVLGSRKLVYFLDPRAVEAYVQNARDTILLSKQHPHIQWLFAGDEVWEHMHIALKDALDLKEDYPELREIDKVIREQYGFGKYGLPESSSDTNPYRWIATYRWEIDQMDKLARRVRELIDNEAPHLKFLSWDSMTGHRPYAIGNWGEIFDVVTAQIYPASSVHRDHLGFTTKFYVDVSNAKEFWPVPHVEHYPNSFTSTEVEEMLSRVFRQGATGLHLWTADYINENRHQKGSSINERIGAPDRWNVVRSVIDRLQEPFKVKRPEPDSAIFYSNTSYQGTGAPRTFNAQNHNEWLYTILGPNLRSTFRFMDEAQITESQNNLSRYKAIYVPFASIVDDAEYNALASYVENGGTLIICDPLAFRNRSDGTQRTSGTILPPLQSQKATPPTALSYTREKKQFPLKALNPSYFLNDTRSTVIARYSNNQPAIIESKHGQGNVIYMGSSPLTMDVISNQPWIDFFGHLQQRLNLTMGHEYWRFRFPSVPDQNSDRPEGMCLTGNYFEWQMSAPTPMANSYSGGGYQFDLPTVNKNEAAQTLIPFTKGKLTDRIRGAQASNDVKATSFVLTWRMAKPLHIHTELPNPVKLHTVRLFYSGNLPEGICEVSEDGQNWQTVGNWKSQSVEAFHDVNQHTVSFPAKQARYLRLSFKENANRLFTLAEFDIWGYE